MPRARPSRHAPRFTSTPRSTPKPPAPHKSPGPAESKKSQNTCQTAPAAYQEQISGLPKGTAYVVKRVKFDGYRNDILLEAKGPGYQNFVRNGTFRAWYNRASDHVSQARNQLQVAHGTPIEWIVAEEAAIPAFQKLLEREGLSRIALKHVRMK